MDRRQFLRTTASIALAASASALPTGAYPSTITYDVFIWPEGDAYALKLVPWVAPQCRRISIVQDDDGVWIPTDAVGNSAAMYAGSIHVDTTTKRRIVTYELTV